MDFLKSKKRTLIEKSESLESYLSDSNKCKPISQKEEHDLFEEYKTANDKRKLEIRDKIITSNQKFVLAIAKRYVQDESLNDVIQEGNLGLFDAFKNYNPDSGNRFCTFAIWYIRRNIVRYLVETKTLLRKSNGAKTFGLIDKIKNNFFLKNGYYPTYEQIREIFDEEYGVKLIENDDVFDYSVVSINNCYDDENERLFENTKEFVDRTQIENDYVQESENADRRKTLEGVMACLDDREKQIVAMAYGLTTGSEMTNEEISKEIGLCAERVRQIKNAAMAKMQAKVAM